jgi:hypothetical protein
LEKLNEVRKALGGQVFDILGNVDASKNLANSLPF